MGYRDAIQKAHDEWVQDYLLNSMRKITDYCVFKEDSIEAIYAQAEKMKADGFDELLSTCSDRDTKVLGLMVQYED